MIQSVGWGDISSYLSNSKPVEQDKVLLAAQGDKPGQAQSDSGDELSISPLAQMLSGDELMESMLGVTAENDRINIEDVARVQQQRIADFQRRMATALKKAGIDVSDPIRLQVDASGSVIVTNEHPCEEEIEALIQRDDALSNNFRHISAVGSLLEAAREAANFQQEYDLDPLAAVRRYGYLFDDQSFTHPFRLTLFESGTSDGGTYQVSEKK